MTPEPRTPPTDDGLTWTRRFAGGLRNDIARRLRCYGDDFRQGLGGKVLASVLFLFFACLANAVAFGGLTGVVTQGEIGTVEMIVATAAGGVVFALFGGQPLTILGGTGPIVIFTGLLYAASRQLELPFLPVYAWVGLWSGLFLIVLSLVDASALMRFFTRFTDEVFAALIAVIFIVEAARSMLGPFTVDEPRHATALLTLLLGLGTFWLALRLKNFSNTPFLWRGVRSFASDFGPAIAIAAMTGAALLLRDVPLEGAAMPERLGTTTGRPWLVDAGALPTWAIFACAGPALMATILLFLDQNITTRLVNTPDHRLKKGPAYHLDLLVVGAIVAVSSLFGLPWIVAATVHALNHVKSLAEVEVVGEGAGRREVIVSVRENRVSGLAIHVLIGLSLLALPLIKLIPMAVLFGLFLFMGVRTLQGNQFWERFTLFFTDPALYPDHHYVQRVRHLKIHLFTAVQVGALISLWVLKSSALGILFPVLIALLVPLRLALGRAYTADELAALDADETGEGLEGVVHEHRASSDDHELPALEEQGAPASDEVAPGAGAPALVQGTTGSS
ncbi:MAG: sodium bicarbonate transporter family protein [Planctomycetota bacterium]